MPPAQDRNQDGKLDRQAAACNGAAALRALREARHARSDPEAAEKALLQALELAPQELDVRLGAYRFYFYNRRYADALAHAQFIVAQSARRLNISLDWRTVCPGDSDFTLLERAPGLYLQALLAWGYCHVRLGNLTLGRAAIAKVAEIDPSDRFGAKSILAQIDNAAPAKTGAARKP